MAVLTIPPGPKGRLLTGSLRDFAERRLGFFTQIAREFGDVVSFRLGARRVWLVNHPDLIEQVLVTDAKHYVKHFGARMYAPLLGNGLLLSEGDFWLRQRRLAQPAFLRNRVLGYVPVMVELTERMLNSWREGETRDIALEMWRLTSAIAARTLLGTDGVADEEAFNSALYEVIQIINKRFRRIFQVPDWMPTPNNLRLKRALKKLDAIVEGFIRQGRERREPGNDLLTMLLQARDTDGSGMTDKQLRDEVMTIFLAGHETTALTLSWTWYLLSDHPEVEEKLAAEWKTVLGGRAPTPADIPKLTFTEHVITESMRLYPPAYLIGREPTKALELGDYRVKRGTTVFLCQWVTHRDPRFFEDADAFKPNRWEVGLAKRLPKYAYFPFGGGPRICIGQQFAMVEAVLLLATIGQRFRFTREPTIVEAEPMITLSPAPGIPATLHARAK